MLNGVESPQISVVGCLLELFFSWKIVISICIEVVTIIIKCVGDGVLLFALIG